jgi:3-oxoacyl-[acyl-carrier protein] reductase
MNENPSPRTWLITGTSSGFGLAIARAALAAGDQVVATARDPRTLEPLRQEAPDRIATVRLDVTNPKQIDDAVAAALKRFGRIDVLVNNAGVARDGVLALFADDAIDQVIDLNLRATIHITRLVTRRMLTQHAGRIINISSIVGLSGYRGLSVYSATKAALDGFTRAMARELGSRGITVNSVAPGYLRTEMSHGLDETQLGQISRRTPAGRLGEAEDVAAAVRFLASPEAGFITGHVLVVDGGLTA